jgi:SAM-dependent methyltransferase
LAESIRDRWAAWLLERRYGGDPERKKSFLDFIAPVRDRVLKNADLSGGETLLDVGAGDGLLAFGALDLLGQDGRVIFSDISQDLLDHSRALAEKAGVLDRCQFLRAPADTDPMLDFDERDLMDLADDAGFEEVHLNYEAAIESGKPVWGVCDWDVLLKSSRNPKIPALREAMDEALTTAEFERFAAHPRPLVEQGRRRGRTAAHAYLWAVK